MGYAGMMRLALIIVLTLLMTGCADKRIVLEYKPDAALTPVSGSQPITVAAFADKRGTEGDNDPYRVGGIYGGYGNRLSKVMVDTPFTATMARALAAGFKARGVQAQAVEQPWQPGTPAPTPLVLTGEVLHFSTEARYTNSAHVAGIVRVYDASRGLLLEKRIDEKEKTGYGGGGVFTDKDDLQGALNAALARWVQQVVTDQEVLGAMSAR